MEDTNHLPQQEFDEFQMINEKAIDTANLAIKSGLIINGGAAVAVLGFLSSILKEQKSFNQLMPSAADALMYFALGVALAVLALGLAYLTHYTALWCINARGKSTEMLAKATKFLLHVFAVAAALAPIGLFVKGAWMIREGILTTLL
ncbi:hypothetical protein ACQU0X_28795 [Pseudovibrio ascidiaceicola]|uniref:hypothetical protein n=1 Tax=Pseudovibrio ascidiaceicola TaxID=285279 RepID=UPI003D3624DC